MGCNIFCRSLVGMCAMLIWYCRISEYLPVPASPGQGFIHKGSIGCPSSGRVFHWTCVAQNLKSELDYCPCLSWTPKDLQFGSAEE